MDECSHVIKKVQQKLPLISCSQVSLELGQCHHQLEAVGTRFCHSPPIRLHFELVTLQTIALLIKQATMPSTQRIDNKYCQDA